MPSRKQRRRREKSRRHEYEYVYVDDEGREVEVDPGELRKERDDKASATATTSKGAGARAGGRPGRKIQPPSWKRVGKRALLFAPLFFITMSLFGRSLTVEQRLVQAVFLLALFLPFSYFMDSIVYRSYLRRTGQAPPTRRGGSNGRA